MQTIMDSGGYLYMTIPIIKQRDLDGYKKIIINHTVTTLNSRNFNRNTTLQKSL